MTRRLSGLFVGVAAVGVWLLSCKSDPTSGLTTDTPSAITTSVSRLVVSQGDTGTFQASVVNPQLVPLTVPVSFAPCTGTVGSVGATRDTSYQPPVANKFQALVAGLTIGSACVVVSGGGLTDTVDAPVAPIIFTGAISRPTAMGGDTISIASTTLLKFSESPVVTFGGGVAGATQAATPDLITVVVPFSDSGALTIANIAPTYITTNEYKLSTSAGFKQVGDLWVGDSSVATAPTLPLPNPGVTAHLITNLFERDNSAVCPDSGRAGRPLQASFAGPCMFYTFTVTDTVTLKFSLNWDGVPVDGTDMDIFACPVVNTSTCRTAPESGTTGKNRNNYLANPQVLVRPEAFAATFGTVGSTTTHYLVLSHWSTNTGAIPPSNLRLDITTRP